MRNHSCIARTYLLTVGQVTDGHINHPVANDDLPRLTGLTPAQIDEAEKELGPLLDHECGESVMLSPEGVREYRALLQRTRRQ